MKWKGKRRQQTRRAEEEEDIDMFVQSTADVCLRALRSLYRDQLFRFEVLSALHTGVKQKPISPTHFLSMRISNPNVIARMKAAQQHVTGQNEKMSTLCVPIEKAHITFGVFHLAKGTDLAPVHAGIELVVKDAQTAGQPVATFGPLGTFGKNVLFIDLDHDEGFERLSQLREKLMGLLGSTSGITLLDKPGPWNPHLTLLKSSMQFRGGSKSGSRKRLQITRDVWETYTDPEELLTDQQEPLVEVEMLEMSTDPETRYYKYVKTYPWSRSTS